MVDTLFPGAASTPLKWMAINFDVMSILLPLSETIACALRIWGAHVSYCTNPCSAPNSMIKRNRDKRRRARCAALVVGNGNIVLSRP